MQKKLVIVCLINFLVAAIMGLMLRYVFVLPLHDIVKPLPFEFRSLMHAHSHGAMLGWVYLMLYVLIVHHFIPDKKPVYNRLFWLTEIAVIGMMVSFPFQGYAAISISFSTLHIICSYLFIRLIWKNHKIQSKPIQLLLKGSLIFMFISTMGIWCLGPAAAKLGIESAFFQIAIQFFLHFQFNGWFMFAVLALFLHQFHLKNSKVFQRFFKTLVAATVLTFALPVSWYAFHPLLLWINGLGVLLQLVTGYYFILLLRPYWSEFWTKTPKLAKWMYVLALISFIIKIALQTSSIVPTISKMAYQYHNFVIGFIHLMMLGVISGFLFAFLLNSSIVSIKRKTLTFGVYCFIIGFITTEVLLLIQGLFYYFALGMIPNYYLLLFVSSIFLPLGILIFTLNILKNETKTIKTT
ncbi:hypothetical protein [Gelidibacter maritimus]|uniref:NnrS family protein n=1 Tax=Gelidibacter maritimus TaxID=2761487 RepID=A0A7W2M1Y1_9FLAO|nr:hypothetical protein [Gelidibacter maritimus]MBA6151234.1 hypothetical protein [Gelidibacter maritimus]